MQRSSSSSTGSKKSIKTEFMIRRYIHLKGQACLKLTANGICKYYIIYVLNILKPEGVQKMNKHTRVQPINKKASACRWGSRFAVMLFPHRKHESEATSQKRHCGWSHSCLMMPPGSCAGLWSTLSLFSVSCIILKCRVCQYVNVLVYFLCVHLMDLRGRLSSSSSLIPITKANSNIWQ